MKPMQWALLSALVALGALIGLLALRNRQPPILPADRDHARFTGANDCLQCHGPQRQHPRGKNHPLGDDCLRCHGMP